MDVPSSRPIFRLPATEDRSTTEWWNCQLSLKKEEQVTDKYIYVWPKTPDFAQSVSKELNKLQVHSRAILEQRLKGQRESQYVPQVESRKSAILDFRGGIPPDGIRSLADKLFQTVCHSGKHLDQ